MRIASWNVRWFPDGQPEPEAEPKPDQQATDIDRLAESMASLDAAIIAVQEFKNHELARRARAELVDKLEQKTGRRYRIRLGDCKDGEVPRVGMLYDQKQFRDVDFHWHDELLLGRSDCSDASSGALSGSFRLKSGWLLRVVVVHLQHGQRPQDYRERTRQYDALTRLVRALSKRDDASIAVLGDFNTHGRKGDDDIDPEEELQRRAAALAEQSPRLQRVPNDRNCTAYFGPVPLALDHAFASDSLWGKLASSSANVGGLCRQQDCEKLKVDPFPTDYRRQSDHCPILITVRP